MELYTCNATPFREYGGADGDDLSSSKDRAPVFARNFPVRTKIVFWELYSVLMFLQRRSAFQEKGLHLYGVTVSTTARRER